jgi:hypothetical protein
MEAAAASVSKRQDIIGCSLHIGRGRGDGRLTGIIGAATMSLLAPQAAKRTSHQAIIRPMGAQKSKDPGKARATKCQPQSSSAEAANIFMNTPPTSFASPAHILLRPDTSLAAGRTLLLAVAPRLPQYQAVKHHLWDWVRGCAS